MEKLWKFLACVAGFLALTAASQASASDFYRQRNLVSDSAAIPAEQRDPNLVNAWGLAFNPYAVAWVADNHTGVATLYNGDGNPQSLVVTIPDALTP